MNTTLGGSPRLAAWLGMRPPPHLDGMAGMIYLFVPAALVGMLLLVAMTRLLGWWLTRPT